MTAGLVRAGRVWVAAPDACRFLQRCIETGQSVTSLLEDALAQGKIEATAMVVTAGVDFGVVPAIPPKETSDLVRVDRVKSPDGPLIKVGQGFWNCLNKPSYRVASD